MEQRVEFADLSSSSVLTVLGPRGRPAIFVVPAACGCSNSSYFFYRLDGLGTTIAVTDVNGKVGDEYTYGPFGEPNKTSGVLYRFAGMPLDPETGLYYDKARVYDPAIGRFLQPDPIGLKGGTNVYAYVGNDPINLTDPSGLVQGDSFGGGSLYGNLGGSGYGNYGAISFGGGSLLGNSGGSAFSATEQSLYGGYVQLAAASEDTLRPFEPGGDIVSGGFMGGGNSYPSYALRPLSEDLYPGTTAGTLDTRLEDQYFYQQLRAAPPVGVTGTPATNPTTPTQRAVDAIRLMLRLLGGN